MTNLTIKQRLFLLLGILLIAILIVITFLIISFKKIEELNVAKQFAVELKSNSYELRKSEKDFIEKGLIDPDFFKEGESEHVKMFENDYNKALGYIKQLKENIHIEGMNVETKIKNLEEDFKGYNKQFLDFIVEIKKAGFKDFGLVGELRTAIHNVEDKIGSLVGQNQLMIDMLMLRRHEKDFIIRKDQKYIDKYNKRIETIKSHIASAGLSSSDELEMLGYIDKYSSTFNNYTKQLELIGLFKNAGIMGEMNKYADKIEPDVADLLDSIVAYSAKTVNQTLVYLVVILLLALLGVGGVALRISGRIYNLLGGEPKQVAEIADKIAAGDLSMNLDEKEYRVGALKSLFVMVQSLKDLVSGIIENSNDLASASKQVNEGVQIISELASEQAAAVEEVSSTMEEMVSNIEQNKDNAQSTMSISKNAYKSISDLSLKSEQTSKANVDIAEKIQLINDIVFQTNILALNAAVESARAGDAGKGFGVVATEVRKLAEHSKAAAEQIVELAQKSVHLNKSADELMKETLPEVQKTNTLVESIAAASIEQNNGASQILRSIDELNKGTQQNAAASEQMSTHAEELALKADMLKSMVAYIKL